MFVKKLCALLALVTATTAANSAHAAPTMPQVNAHFSSSGDEFEQKITVVFTPALELEKIRQYSENTTLMKSLSEFVTDAAYKIEGTDQQFWLTIGKSAANCTHMFHCDEKMNETQWQLACNEDANVPEGKKVLLSGSKRMQCMNTKAEGETPSLTTCVYEMNGHASDLDILFFHFSARHLSYDLFEETVNYVVGLSYLAAGISAEPTNIKKQILASPAYGAFLKNIDETTKEVKNSDLKKPVALDFSAPSA